jgi:hypothetical protein
LKETIIGAMIASGRGPEMKAVRWFGMQNPSFRAHQRSICKPLHSRHYRASYA